MVKGQKINTLVDAIQSAERRLNISSQKMADLLGMPLSSLEELKNGYIPYPQYEVALWMAVAYVLQKQLESPPKIDIKEMHRQALEKVLKVTATYDKAEGTYTQINAERL